MTTWTALWALPHRGREDEAAHGEYRTERVILEMYDAMQIAVDAGTPYQTRLEPPPAHESVAHPPRNVLKRAKLELS